MSKRLLLHPSCCRVHRQVLLRETQGAQARHVSPHYCQVSIHPGKKSDASCVCHCFVVLVVCTCVCTHVCACVQVCVSQTSTSGFFLNCSLLHIFGEQDLSLNLEFTGMVSQKTRGPTVSTSPTRGLYTHAAVPGWRSEPGPHHRIATMSLMELKIFLCAFWAFVPNTVGVG